MYIAVHPFFKQKTYAIHNNKDQGEMCQNNVISSRTTEKTEPMLAVWLDARDKVIRLWPDLQPEKLHSRPDLHPEKLHSLAVYLYSWPA